MKDACPEDLPRWIYYQLEFTAKSGAQSKKIVFVNYSPDDCTKMNIKFPYQQHKDKVKSKLNPNKEFQVNEHADLDREKFINDM